MADPAERKRVLLRLAELIREHAEELALLDSLDMGKPVEDALGVDVPGAAGSSVVRRGRRQALRRDRADRRRRPGDGHARAARRRRRRRAVELPARPRDLEGRAGARGRQQRRAEAGRAVAAVGDPARRAGRRGRAARRRPQRGPGLGETAGARSAATPTSTASPSPARPRSAGCSLGYSAESNGKPVWLEAAARARTWSSPTRTTSSAPPTWPPSIFSNQGEVLSQLAAARRALDPRRVHGAPARARAVGARRRPARSRDDDGAAGRRGTRRPRARLHRGRARAGDPAPRRRAGGGERPRPLLRRADRDRRHRQRRPARAGGDLRRCSR